MGSDVVVVVQPGTHSLLHLCKGEEEIHVEALISKLTIEALNVAIFNGFSGSYEVELRFPQKQRPQAPGAKQMGNN